MRNAETILGIIREDVYRQLYNHKLFLHAYGRIYRNDGAMTPGATKETVDGMSLEKINAIVNACATSAIDGLQYGEHTSPRNWGECARWASPLGRTNYCKR